MTESWLERWSEGRIGWHEPGGNASLKKFWRWSGRQVLVPLCGKSLDLIWLARKGNEVTGIELSELAIMAFYAENDLAYRVEQAGMPVYRATDLPIKIFCGDYFAFDSGRYDAHYDRGALVAIPEELRPAYVAHTNDLLEDVAEQLVITLEYDQQIAAGPPYSVSTTEMLAHWPNLVRIDAREDIENAPPKFQEAGLESFVEVVWSTG